MNQTIFDIIEDCMYYIRRIEEDQQTREVEKALIELREVIECKLHRWD